MHSNTSFRRNATSASAATDSVIVWAEAETDRMGSQAMSVKEGRGTVDPLDTSLDSTVMSIGSDMPTETSVEETLVD